MPVSRYSDADVSAGATRLDGIGVRVEFAFVLLVLMVPLTVAIVKHARTILLAIRAAEAADKAAGIAPERGAKSVWSQFVHHPTARTALFHTVANCLMIPWMLTVLILGEEGSLNFKGWVALLAALGYCAMLLCRYRIVKLVLSIFGSLEKVLSTPEQKAQVQRFSHFASVAPTMHLVLGPLCATTCLALCGWFSNETTEWLVIAFNLCQSVGIMGGPIFGIFVLRFVTRALEQHCEVTMAPLSKPAANNVVRVQPGDVEASAAKPASAPPSPAQLLYMQASFRLGGMRKAIWVAGFSLLGQALGTCVPYLRERFTYMLLVVLLGPLLANTINVIHLPTEIPKRKRNEQQMQMQAQPIKSSGSAGNTRVAPATVQPQPSSPSSAVVLVQPQSSPSSLPSAASPTAASGVNSSTAS